MKGISYWFWIIGGVIAGLAIFAAAYQLMADISLRNAEQRSLEQFSQVKGMINNLCWEFVGNKREYSMDLSEYVEGIYTTFDKYTEYEKEELIENIISGNNSTGDFICIKIAKKRVRCEKLECNATMPFIGSLPEGFSLSALINRLLGRGKIFEYPLEFERMGNEVAIFLK